MNELMYDPIMEVPRHSFCGTGRARLTSSHLIRGRKEIDYSHKTEQNSSGYQVCQLDFLENNLVFFPSFAIFEGSFLRIKVI